MIKAGDKVVCIEDYNSFIFDVIKQKYIKGKIYKIIDINGEYDIYIEGEIKNKNGWIGHWFYTNSFSKYFIPLAEYREQQIKSVLDE